MSIAANSQHVRRYLTVVRPIIEPCLEIPEDQLRKKHRGSSRVPIGENAEAVMWANREAATILEPIIARKMREQVRRKFVRAFSDEDFAGFILEAEANPAATTYWKGERWYAFLKHCRQIAEEATPAVNARQQQQVEAGEREPDRWTGELEVVVHPDDEPKRAKTKEAYNRERDEGRRETLRRIHARWENTKRERGCGSERAKEILHTERNIHPKRVEEAITFVNKERENGDSAA